MTEEFSVALLKTFDEHEQLGDVGDLEENGAMRAVGVARADTVKLATSLLDTSGLDLATGWTCSCCGELRDKDGDCPEGCEFDKSQTSRGGKVGTLLAIVEICVALGVNLERTRTDAVLREVSSL